MNQGRPVPLGAKVEEHDMEHEALWRRAQCPRSPGGATVTHDEAMGIYQHRRDEYAPDLYRLCASVQVIGQIVGGSAGIDSPRVHRTLTQWWARASAPFRRAQAA